MKHRILSLFLALVMVIGLLPVTARAVGLDNGLQYEVYEDHVEITEYYGGPAEIVIPKQIEGLPVTTIGTHAFGCTPVISIIIPDGVTKIGEYAFSECTDLINIVIPDSVTQIGSSAFHACSSLDNIRLPAGITQINRATFYGCWSLSHIEIPENVTQIGDMAFLGCRSLTSIRFKGNAPTFGNDVFYNVKAVALYPAGNPTWTANVMQDYGGTITWVPYNPENASPMPDPIGDTHDTIDELTDEDYWALSKIAYWDFDEYFDKTLKEALTGMGKWNTTVKDTDIKYSELCEAIGHWKVVDVDNYSNANGFYGVTFANGDDAVIAYRGSIPLTSADAVFSKDALFDWVLNDLYPILTNRLFSQGQYKNAIAMYENAIKSYRNIAVTGHSLGGGLADIVSAHYGCKGVSMNAISILDTCYAKLPKLFGSSFAGVDKWNFVDHANQFDLLAGAFEIAFAAIGATKLKPVIIHATDSNLFDITKIVYYHGLESYITRNSKGELALTSRTGVFTPNNTISNYMSTTGTSIDLGTSGSDLINKGLSVAAARTSYGGNGNDTISSNVWNDIIIGGRGSDDLDGSWGDDTYAYYKGDGVDTIHDIGGNDWLVLLGFTEDDTFSVVEDPGSDFICVTNGGKDIVRISKKNRDRTLFTTNRFKIVLDHGQNTEAELFDITDAFDTYTSGEHLYIGCPVHVEVLDSNGNMVFTLTDGEVGTWYTDYGNFYVFEEESGEYGKILDLVEGYTARIVGAGEGTMGVTYQVPVDGKLTEPVSVFNVPVTEELIATVEENEEGDIYLIIDSNGDGETDSEKKLYAECPFTDVTPSDYYYTPVLWAVENKITSGTASDKFSPYDSCLRSQVVTFLWRAAGKPAPKSQVNPFEDVKPGDYYYNAVLWAVENGITYGADDTHFEPNGVCSRSQVVSFLYRAFKKPPVAGASNPFDDVPAGAWYASAVQWAVKEGIAYGTSETEFSPDDTCNRSQVVTFLYRAYN